ncbi:RelA/SpoT domain-containing protein [Pseudoxanthomonas winnipegensis]|uniref:(P)ppGpp synthetase n=1 Tax=Pseudoxanthomonas winnipegensis TaxID=2480810 RepID=A0A4V2HDA6_9GAMM|nr:RelA/SpoT domain-containing protein [Pseudoxanthomonas winnipegensis]TAA26582.1 (p)ppGpp synthetase [Pseudoxanthomonas winnipegensis]
MAFETPRYSRRQVKLAGESLRAVPIVSEDVYRALPIISNWRAAHAYPLNTFQATLRKKLNALGLHGQEVVVGQRLKRLPSIAAKLDRFHTMALDRMQDIAGLRAVLPGVKKLQLLAHSYYDASRFTHELRQVHDYVAAPKPDGYRSIHLVYRYNNPRAPAYEGLHVELQLRTALQHAWATAVETVDAFANQAIKAGRAEPQWAEFFTLASAAFAFTEGSPRPAHLEHLTVDEVHAALAESERHLNVLIRLRGFSVAADKIHESGKSSGYHLVVLNTQDRTLSIKSYSIAELDAATEAYTATEQRAASGEPLDAVLVAGGSVNQLRKTYPNYFLDASVFLDYVGRICVRENAKAHDGHR